MLPMVVSFTRRMAVVLAALFVVLPPAAQAQSEQDAPDDSHVTPSRLSIVEGPVQFWRSGVTEWAEAQLNTALATGDSIRTGERGTAEIQVGPQDYVRLTGNTTVTVVAQGTGLLQFRVVAGTASFDLRSVHAGQMIEIDTPQGAVVVERAGYYRVDIVSGATHLTVRQGGQAAMVLGDGRNQAISSNEMVILTGSEGSAAAERHAAPEADAWDRWNDARSDYYANSYSQRYVSAGVYGVADLDRNGVWREVPTYGYVWIPAVASGWVPYSTGRWQWDPVFGWTWVDVAPWGWTTSHYGRWVFIDGFWAWAPGPRVVRPLYAPALVAFFEGGSGVSWVALGWGEPLIPWWGRPGFRGTPWWGGWGGPRLVNHRPHRSGPVDVGTIRFVHAGVPSAVITARHEEFHRDRFHGSRLPPSQARDVVPIRGAHPVKPTGPVGIVVTTPARPEPQPMPRPEMPQFPRPEIQPMPRPSMPSMPRPSMPSMPRPEMPQFPRPEMQPLPRPSMPSMPPPIQQPAVQPTPQLMPQPTVQPVPHRVAPQPSPMSSPMAAPAAPPVQRPTIVAPMQGMNVPMPRNDERDFRDRGHDRRFDEHPRMEMRGGPLRFDYPQRSPGEPPQGRPFRQREP